MKKLLCIVLCLALFLPIAAGAEEAVSQLVFARMFEYKLNRFLSSLNLDEEALEFTLDTQENRSASAALQAQDGLYSLSAQVMGSSAELQIGRDAAWLSWNGQVYVLHYSLFRELYALLQPDTLSVLPAIIQQFAADVILPGVTMEQQADKSVIHINYTTETLKQGLAAFGDHVLLEDRYADALMPLVEWFGSSLNLSLPSLKDLQAMWLSFRDQLLAVDIDISLTGTVTTEWNAEACEFALRGPGVDMSVQGERRVQNGVVVISAQITSNGNADLVFSCSYDQRLRAFEAELSLPLVRESVRMTGSSWDEGCECELSCLSHGKQTFGAQLTATTHDYGFVLQLAVISGSATSVLNLNVMERHMDLSWNQNGRAAASLVLDTEEDGRFTVKLTLPMNAVSVLLTGQMEDGTLHLSGTYTYRGYEMITGEATICSDWDTLTILATVNDYSIRKTYTARLVSTENVLTFGLTGGDEQLSFRLEKSGRLQVSDMSSLYALILDGRFESETVYRLDVSQTQLYFMDHTENHLFLDVSGKDAILLRGEDESGAETFQARLAKVPVRPITPLESAEQTEIDLAFLLSLFR